jgi:hypothetical protein
MTAYRAVVLLFAAVGVSVACSSSSGSSSPDGGAPEEGTPAFADASTGPESGATREAAPEAMSDATALDCPTGDLHAQYVAGATDLDLDCDGKDDWHVDRAADGTPQRETLDVDEDGRPDFAIDRTASPQTEQIDRNLDGKWDEEIDWTQGSDPQDYSFVELYDVYFTGTYTRRVTSTSTPGSDTIDVLEESLQPDGSWSTDSESSTARDTTKIANNVETSGPNACTPDQATKIEKAFTDVEADVQCLGGFDKGLALRMRWMLAFSENPDVSCAPQPVDSAGNPQGVCADSYGVVPGGCPYGYCSHITISLYPYGFDPSKCGDLGTSLFHELLHYLLGGHRFDNGSQDPNDPIYGCERLCGTPGAQKQASDCGACLQTSTGDARCASLARDCSPKDGGYCQCTGTVYPRYSDCTVACPSGTTCFASACTHVMGPPICEMEGVPCMCGCCDGLACDPTTKVCTSG